MATETRCYFEKALISGCAKCSQARRRDIGERLLYYCGSATAAQRCERYVSLLRQNARFVFRQPLASEPILSNYQDICLQCGGLQGLAGIVNGDPDEVITDVSQLLQAFDDEHQGIESISLDQIVPRIAAYNPRPHRKKK